MPPFNMAFLSLEPMCSFCIFTAFLRCKITIFLPIRQIFVSLFSVYNTLLIETSDIMNIKIDFNFQFSVLSIQYTPQGELCITLLSAEQPAASLGGVSIKSFLQCRRAKPQFFHHCMGLIVTEPMVSICAVANNMPKSSFSSICSSCDCILRLAPSESILKKKGNKWSEM